MSIRLDVGPPLPAEWAAEARAARERLRGTIEALAATPPGFVALLETEDGIVRRCREEAERLSAFDRIVLLGIGGSALGARALRDALAPERAERLVVLDNIDPDTVVRTRDRLDPASTGFLVISKSGSTAETAAQFLYFREWLDAAGIDPTSRMTFITDPAAGPLRALATRDGFRALEIPPAVGGRFSVLTAVGLLPAAILGIDPEELLAGGRALWRAVRDRADHPLLDWTVAHALRAAHERRTIQVLMPYVDRLRTFADWFAQLWGESLGKHSDRRGRPVRRGSTPLAALGATDQHSLVQLFVEGPADKQFLVLGLRLAEPARAPLPRDARAVSADFGYLSGASLDRLFEAERIGTGEALAAAGGPVSTLELARIDAPTLGALFVFFELATVLTAELWEIDPYDQPGVELGKWLAFARLGRPGYADKVRAALGEPPAPRTPRPLL